ncbi:hypothetical protein V1477_004118 [Vespula maculifrons]|uniref:Uncharacterized protein n=1 Tax=Vespula maculifrons TaxID=7453 RepID=A0ABD2CQP4_VESMC
MAILRTTESAHGNEIRRLKYIIEYLTGFHSHPALGDRGTNHRGIFTRKHDRSCLEMSEADGVDGGAICKRGFTHLQFAEKSEAPEAERHLGSWILE